MKTMRARSGPFSGASSRCAGFCVVIAWVVGPATAGAQIVPYNPYADSQDPTPAVLPDGTIHWGTFYKSAAIQKAYERLWNLGACRNTNKAITIPVENNRLKIDSLPEGEFRGIVIAVTGTNAGGAIAFAESSGDASAAERVALLHPAGVSRVEVSGTATAGFLLPGMTVRFQTKVDARGRAAEPLRGIQVITLPRDAKPVPVTVDREDVVVGRVVALTRNVLSVRIDTGKIRRLSVPLADDVVVEVQSTDVSLVRVGDHLEIEGRLWTGEGALGDGSVFADRLTVVKRGPDPIRQPVTPATVGGTTR